jgi:hypothetical protein
MIEVANEKPDDHRHAINVPRAFTMFYPTASPEDWLLTGADTQLEISYNVPGYNPSASS